MKKLEYFKVVLILPGNVLITIPLIIFFLTKRTYSYNLINLNSVLFYISLLFLIVGLWLAIWSVRTFYNHGGDGTPGPWKPVSKLIIAGPYCYMRNPMLMGVFFLLLFENQVGSFSSIIDLASEWKVATFIRSSYLSNLYRILLAKVLL